MRENRDFVVPVNILTPLRAPRFLGLHNTLPLALPCVLIHGCLVIYKGCSLYQHFILTQYLHTTP